MSVRALLAALLALAAPQARGAGEPSSALGVWPTWMEAQGADSALESELDRAALSSGRVRVVSASAMRVHARSARDLGLECVAEDSACMAKVGALAHLDVLLAARAVGDRVLLSLIDVGRGEVVRTAEVGRSEVGVAVEALLEGGLPASGPASAAPSTQEARGAPPLAGGPLDPAAGGQPSSTQGSERPPSPLLVPGAVVLGTGAALGVGGGAAALGIDAALGASWGPPEARAATQAAGVALVVIAGLGALGAAVGGGLVAAALVGSEL